MTATTGRQHDWEKLDDERRRSAVSEIAASDNLRFFFRELFSDYGALAPVAGLTDMELARRAAHHEVTMDIIGRLDQQDFTLFPALLVEQNQEMIRRNGSNEEDE